MEGVYFDKVISPTHSPIVSRLTAENSRYSIPYLMANLIQPQPLHID